MHSHNRTLISKLGFADQDRKSPRHDMACRYLGEHEQLQKLAKVAWPRLVKHGPPSQEETAAIWAAKRSLRVRVNEDAVEILSCSSFANDSHAAWLKDNETLCRKVFRDEELKFDERRWLETYKVPSFETPIQKGTGQYQTTVGFLDMHVDMFIGKHERLCAQRLRDRSKVSTPFTIESYNAAPLTDVVEFYAQLESIKQTLCVEVKIGPVPASEILRQVRFYGEYFEGSWIAATDFDLDSSGIALLRSQGVAHVRLGRGLDNYIDECGRWTVSESPEI